MFIAELQNTPIWAAKGDERGNVYREKIACALTDKHKTPCRLDLQKKKDATTSEFILLKKITYC